MIFSISHAHLLLLTNLQEKGKKLLQVLGRRGIKKDRPFHLHKSTLKTELHVL